MRIPAALLLTCSLASCAHTGWRENRPFAQQDGDFAMIAAAAMTQVERYGAVTHIVVPAGLDRRALDALKRQRPVVPASELADARALPGGYFLVEAFSIDADGSAVFAGDLGPTGCPGGCGRNITIPYVLRGDDWYSPSVKIVDYSIRREVIPVGESR